MRVNRAALRRVKFIMEKLRLTAFLLIIAVFSASCGSPKNEAPAPKGHYLEHKLELESISQIQFMTPGTDSGLEFYGTDDEGNFICEIYDGQSVRKKDTSWAGSLEGFINQLVRGLDGKLYLLTSNWSEEEERLLYQCYLVDEASRTLSEILLQLPDEKTNIRDLQVLENSEMLISLDPQGLCLYLPDGNLKMEFPPLRGRGLIISGEQLITVSDQSGQILYFDSQNGDEIQQATFSGDPIAETVLFTDDENRLYTCNSVGCYRYIEASEEWEQVIDGKNTFLSFPDYRILFADALPDHSVVVLFQDLDGNQELLRYVYTENAPERTVRLTVGALEPSGTLNRAVVTFQREHPEVGVVKEVVYTNPDEINAAAVSDALKQINTALLAGKGSDLYVLNRLPWKSYVEKGALMDLSDLISTHSEEWLVNLTQGFQVDGKCCVMPVRFSVPMLWGESDLIGSSGDLASLTDWAVSHADLKLFYSMNPQNLLDRFYPVCVPAWENSSGEELESLMEEFFRSIQQMAETSPDGIDVEGRFTGKNRAIAHNVDSAGTVTDSNAIMEQTGGGSMVYLPGQAKQVYVPMLMMGINAKSSRKETALEFLESMLSESVQSTSLFSTEGLPVNRKALEKCVHMTQQQREEFFSSGTYMLEDQTMVETEYYGWMPESVRTEFLRLCETLTVPSVRDDQLYQMMLEESEPFFKGERSLEETAKTAASRLQTRLME